MRKTEGFILVVPGRSQESAMPTPHWQSYMG